MKTTTPTPAILAATILLLLPALPACRRASPPATASGGDRASPGPRWADAFDPYPGARTLCSQHVAGPSGHIEWTGYATGDEVERVVAFYRGRAGDAAVESMPSGGWVLAGADGARLSVIPASGQYPHCGVDPAASERTVLIVSRLIGGAANAPPPAP